MKKITLVLVVALICSTSLFATRYLVQKGGLGDATWRAAGVGETLVDLTVESKSFNVWYNGSGASSGDEVWVITGTYVTTGVTTMISGVSIYGGFAGTENTLGDRAKVVSGKPWEFVNVTTIDGNNTNKGFSSADLATDTYIDGLTITKCKATVGAGAEIKKKTIIRNCIVKDSEATATNNDSGGGVRVIGGTLQDSYIFNNKSSAGGAGGVGVQSTSLVKGCTIEKNQVIDANKGGGGVNIATSGGSTIEDCIIINNTAPTGAGLNSFFGSAQSAITVKNTQIIDNKASANGGGVFLNISTGSISFENCTIKGNTATSTNGGGIRINAAAITLKNCIITDNNSGGNGTALYSQSTSAVSIYNCLIYNNGVEKAAVHLQNNPTINIFNTTLASNKGNVIYFATKDMTNTTLKNVLICNNEKTISFADGTASHPTVTYTAFDTDVSAQPYFGTGCITTITGANTFVQPTSFKGIHTNATDSVEIVNSDWQIIYTSPALNDGTTESASNKDFLDVSRPQGTAYDMGAYELPYYSATVSFNDKGKVNGESAGFVLSEPKGKPVVYTLTPNSGMKVASLKYNDVDVDVIGDMVGNTYTAPALAANSTLEVTFDIETSVENLNSANFIYYSANNTLILKGLNANQTINVYSVTGALIFNTKSQTSELNIPLSKGVYLVKVDNHVQKVSIR